METPSIFRFSIILFTLVLMFATASWYTTSKQGILRCSKTTIWCNFSNGKSKLSSVLETPILKPNNLATNTPSHPLDPLTVQEINRVRAILSSYEPFSLSFPSIHSLSLDEPEKTLVLEWRNGDPLPPRKASAVTILNGEVHLLIVDLDLGQVTSHVKNQGSGYPMLSMDDIIVALQVTSTSKEFNQSIIARGLQFRDLSCLTPSPGWFGPEEEGRRIAKVECFVNQDSPNFYMRPIEGLVIIVDIDNRKIVKVLDSGRGIPVPKAKNTDYRYQAQNRPPKMQPLNPISIEQPQGPSFTIEDGHIVRWANWIFHLKADQRAGMVICKAMVQDSETGEFRSVMYKGFASELFVPYMDLSDNWYFKSFMDAGEFGLGAMALSLVPLNDCPRYSSYMDGVFVYADGRPYIQPNMICIFEKYAGDIGWRHSELPVNGFEVTCYYYFFKYTL